MSVFGIDLGTTYSCIARYNPETQKPETIMPNTERSVLIPSVVYFESGSKEVVVGKVADVCLRGNQGDASRGKRLIKRDMGKDDVLLTVDDMGYKAHELSTFILKFLKGSVERKINEIVEDVVITVPAYFGYAEREATQKAGEAAGLRVRALIEEPTAAALSYFAEYKGTDPINVFVYDLGGGTFDINALTMTVGEDGSKHVLILKTDGDHELGGANWDHTLFDLAKRKFVEQHPNEELEAEAEASMFAQAEDVKIDLTFRNKAKFIFKQGNERKEIEVTREEFEAATKSLLALTESRCENVKNSDELSGIKFDKVLLTGGSANMPAVYEMIKRVFPDCEILTPDFNEAVAKGAAIACHFIECGLWNIDGSDQPKPPETDEPKPPENNETQPSETAEENNTTTPLPPEDTIIYVPQVPKALGFRVEDESGNLIINVRFFKGEELDGKTHSLTRTITDYKTKRDNMDSITIAVFELVYEDAENPNVPVDWADGKHKKVAGFNPYQIRYLDELKMPLEPNQPAHTPLTLIVTVSESGLHMECFNASIPDSKHHDCTISIVSDIDPKKISCYTVDSE